MTRTAEQHCAGMKVIHDHRRKQGRCINNKGHGKAYRGGRCRRCWGKKLTRERELYAERKP